MVKTQRIFNKKTLNLLSLALLIINISCSDNEFSLGEKYIESQADVILIDTFTVKASTILIDSMSTSGDSLLLVGYYCDSIFGKLHANSYFQIGIPESKNLEEDDVFDSITLKFKYTGYYYGDTNSIFGFTIHKLMNEPELNSDGYLYNSSTVKYFDEPFASYYVKPHPGKQDTIEITLPYAMGLDFLSRMQEGDDVFASDASFTEYFNGLAFIADTTITKSIIEFKAIASTLKLRLYYHRNGQVKRQLYCDMPVINIDKQFNQISHDFSGTELVSLVNQRKELQSENTNNNIFLLGGIGLMPKLQFPYLQEILYFNRGSILKVELVLKPESSSYSHVSLPTGLILFQADKYNRFNDPIYDSDGNAQVSTFRLDNLYHENTSYTFDITYYILNELADGNYNSENGLFVSSSSSLYSNTITRLILECNPAPQLRIYYVTF